MDEYEAEKTMARALVEEYREVGNHGGDVGRELTHMLEDMWPDHDWDGDACTAGDEIIGFAMELLDEDAKGRQNSNVGDLDQALKTLGIAS